MLDDIKDKLAALLEQRFVIDAAQVNFDVRLQDDLSMDSMDAVDLLLAVNETFQVRIPESALESIHTVGDLVSIIQQYQSAKGA